MAKQSNSDVARTEAPQSRKKWIIENLTSLGLALLLVFMVRSSVIEAFKIPSGSMIPTLLVGDHIFVNKFAYGIKVPFSDWIGDEPIYLYKRTPPQRGDIIVFKFPQDESLYFIKRVIGTPGDTIELRDKELYINGKKVSRKPVSDQKRTKVMDLLENSNYTRENLDVFDETIDHVTHDMMLDRSSYLSDRFGPITVPADMYFVMGDNRDYSNDSRVWGFVPFRNVRGRAIVIWLSAWISFQNKDFVFRPTRIGTVLR